MTNFPYDEISYKLNSIQEVFINLHNLKDWVKKNNSTNELRDNINELERKLIINLFLDRNDSDEVRLNKLHSILNYINGMINEDKDKIPSDSNLKDFYLYIQSILENEYNLLYQHVCKHPIYYLEDGFSIQDSNLGTCYSCRCLECGKVMDVPLRQLKDRLICDYGNWFIQVPLKPSVTLDEVQEAYVELKKEAPKEAVPVMLKRYVKFRKEPI